MPLRPQTSPPYQGRESRTSDGRMSHVPSGKISMNRNVTNLVSFWLLNLGRKRRSHRRGSTLACSVFNGNLRRARWSTNDCHEQPPPIDQRCRSTIRLPHGSNRGERHFNIIRRRSPLGEAIAVRARTIGGQANFSGPHAAAMMRPGRRTRQQTEDTTATASSGDPTTCCPDAPSSGSALDAFGQ